MHVGSKRARVLAVAIGLLCAATAVAWVAHNGDGASGAMDSTAGSDRPGPAVQPAMEKVVNQVVIDNFKFEPRQLTVTAGTKVTWVNRDDVPHTATSVARPKAFDSKTLDTDQQFSQVFTTPGTYAYFCAVHPHMRGEIIVK
jgi:plastocyanin